MLYRTDEDNNLIPIAGNSNLAYQGNSLPIGAIFTSALPQTSNKYHLLNGDCLEVNGIYNGFFNYLISLVSQGYSVTCTANEYAEILSKNKSCGKFILNNTSSEITGSYTNENEEMTEFIIPAYSFKLPTITTFIQGINSLVDIGSSIEAGLPNIEGSIVRNDKAYPLIFGYTQNLTEEGALSANWETCSNQVDSSTGATTAPRSVGFNFDASLSNPIYGNSETVQPSSVQYPYYIVLISGASTNIQANPTITGEEQVLNSINIGGVNYLLGNGGNKLNLIWENSNPTSEFSSQTLSLNLSDYEFLIIQTRHYNTYIDYGEINNDIVLKNDENGMIKSFYLTTASVNQSVSWAGRSCTVTDSEIVFGDAYLKTTNEINTNTLNNNSAVPMKIYGIKLGSSSSQQFKPQVYSTEETPIGVWIDGKTIYRKTLDCSNLTTNFGASGWKIIQDLTDFNIDTFIGIEDGVIFDGTRDRFYGNFYFQCSFYQNILYGAGTDELSTIYIKHLNVKYTKTTD